MVGKGSIVHTVFLPQPDHVKIRGQDQEHFLPREKELFVPSLSPCVVGPQ